MNKFWKVVMCLCMVMSLWPMNVGYANEGDASDPIVETSGVSLEELRAQKKEMIHNAHVFDANLFVKEVYEETIRDIDADIDAMDEIGLNALSETSFLERFETDEILTEEGRRIRDLNAKRKGCIQKIKETYPYIEGEYRSEGDYNTALASAIGYVEDCNSIDDIDDIKSDLWLRINIAMQSVYSDSKKLELAKERKIFEIKKTYNNDSGKYKETEYQRVLDEVIGKINSYEDLSDINDVNDKQIEAMFNAILSAAGSIEVARQEKIAAIEEEYKFIDGKYDAERHENVLNEVRDIVRLAERDVLENKQECKDGKTLDAYIDGLFKAILTETAAVERARDDKVKELKERYPYMASLYLKDEYDALVNRIKEESIDPLNVVGDIDGVDVESFSKQFSDIERPEDLYLKKENLSEFEVVINGRKYTLDSLDGSLTSTGDTQEVSSKDVISIKLKGRLWDHKDWVEGSNEAKPLTGKHGIRKNQRILMELPEIIKEKDTVIGENGKAQKEWVSYVTDKTHPFARKSAMEKFGTDVDPNGDKIPDLAVGVYRILPGDGKNLLVIEYLNEYLEENFKTDNVEYPDENCAGIQDVDIQLESQINTTKVTIEQDGKYLIFGDIRILVKFVPFTKLTDVSLDAEYNWKRDESHRDELEDYAYQKTPYGDIYTSPDDNYVYYRVTLNANNENTEMLRNVVVTQLCDHKYFNHFELVKATRGSREIDITEQVKNPVRFKEAYVELDDIEDSTDVPTKKYLDLTKKSYSYMIGNLVRGMDVTLVFRAELNPERIGKDIQKLKTLDETGVHFDRELMKEACTARSDFFVTADNLYKYDGTENQEETKKKVVVHEAVKPTLRNNHYVSTTATRSPGYDHVHHGRGNRNQTIYKVHLDYGDNKDRAKYWLSYLPFVGKITPSDDAKLSYIENLEICDKSGKVISNSKIKNFKVHRDAAGNINGYEGIYENLPIPGQNAQGEEFYVLLTYKKELWDEDRTPDNGEWHGVKSGYFTNKVTVGDTVANSDFEVTNSRYYYAHSYFRRYWITKSSTRRYDEGAIDWHITVYPTETPDERIVKDIFPITEIERHKLSGVVRIQYVSMNGTKKTEEKTLTDAEASGFTYVIPRENWEDTVHFHVSSTNVSDASFAKTKYFENKATVEAEGFKHYATSSDYVGPKGEGGGRSYRFDKVLVDHRKLESASWRLEIPYSLTRYETGECDTIVERFITDNMYMTSEQKDALKVLLFDEASGGYKEISKDQYEVEDILFESAPGKKNAEQLDGKIVGFKLKPTSKIISDKHPIHIVYDTSLILPPYGKNVPIDNPNERVRYQSTPLDKYESEAISVVYEEKDGALIPKNGESFNIQFWKSNNKEVHVYYSHRDGDYLYWHIVGNANGYLNEHLEMPERYEESHYYSKSHSIKYSPTLYVELPEGLVFDRALPLKNTKWPDWTFEKYGHPIHYYRGSKKGSSGKAPQIMDDYSSSYELGDYASEFKVNASEYVDQTGVIPIQLPNLTEADKREYQNYYWFQLVVRTRIVNEELLLGLFPQKQDLTDAEPQEATKVRYRVEAGFTEDHSKEKYLWDDSLSEEIIFEPMSKVVRYSSGLTVDYEIDMNRDGINLLKEKDVIRLFDTSSPTLEHIVSSISVNDGDGNVLRLVDAEEAKTADPSMTYQIDTTQLKDKHTVIFTLPDNKHLQIHYRARILPSASGSIAEIAKVSNVAYFGDYVDYKDKEVETSEITVVANDGSTIGQDQVFLMKSDEQAQLIKDAQYEYWTFNGTWSDSKVVEINNNKSGKRFSIAEPYVLYAFKEFKAPEGYAWDDEVKYLMLVNYEDLGTKLEEKLEFAGYPEVGIDGEAFDKSKVKYFVRNEQVTFQDETIHELLVNKVDSETNKVLPGAEFVLYDMSQHGDKFKKEDVALKPRRQKEDKAVEIRWTSGEKAEKIDITAGMYLLEETVTPAGYLPGKPMLFEVHLNGDVSICEAVPVEGGFYKKAVDVETFNKTSENALVRAIEKLLKTKTEVTLKNTPTKVKILKKKQNQGEEAVPFDGVKFKLIDKNGKEVVGTTKDGGFVEFTNLVIGDSYTIQEEAPVDGGIHYRNVKPFTVTVKDTGKLTVGSDELGALVTYDEESNVITVLNKPVHIEIAKKIFDTDKLLSGVELQLIEEGLIEHKVTWNTANENPKVFHGDLKIGKTYRIHEETGLENYLPLKQDIRFVVKDSSELELLDGLEEEVKIDGTTVNVFNKTRNMKVSKLVADIEEEKALPGVEFELTEDGNSIKKWTSTNEAIELDGIKFDTPYILWERQATPTSEKLEKGIEFKYFDDGRLELLNLVNKEGAKSPIDKSAAKKHGNILKVFNKASIVKVSKLIAGTQDPLEDVHFDLLDEHNNKIDEWDTAKDAKVLAGVVEFDRWYKLKETQKDGYYALGRNVEFRLKRDKTLELNSEITENVARVVNGDEIQIFNEPTVVKIGKYRFDSKEALPGVELQVFDTNDQPVTEVFESKITPEMFKGVFKVGETYKIREIKKLDGYYALPNDIEFVVNENHSIRLQNTEATIHGENLEVAVVEGDEIKIFNEPTKFFVSKIRIDEKVLSGARLGIKKADEKKAPYLIDWMSEVNDKAITAVVNNNETYVIHEIQPPEKYQTIPEEIQNTFKFTFVDGNVVPVNKEENEFIRYEENKITLVNDKIYEPKVYLKKVNEFDEPLANVPFTITEAGTNRKISVTTDGNGLITLTEQEHGLKLNTAYTVHEDQFVDEANQLYYLENPDFTFKLDKRNAVENIANVKLHGITLFDIEKRPNIDEADTIKITNVMTRFFVKKVTDENQPIGGLEFDVVDEHVGIHKTIVTRTAENATTNVGERLGEAMIYGLKPGRYDLVEKKAPTLNNKNYVRRTYHIKAYEAANKDIIALIADDKHMDEIQEVMNGAPVKGFLLKDDPTELTFTKYAKKVKGDYRNTLLGDAELQVVDPGGNVIDSWNSTDSNPHVFEKGLLKSDVRYHLEETKAPAGYVRDEDGITFEIVEDGVIRVYPKDGTDDDYDEITNKNLDLVNSQQITILKYDDYLKVPITGATFVFTEYSFDDRKYISINDESGYKFEYDLPFDRTFTLKETVTPSGYIPFDPYEEIKFKITRKNGIEIVSNQSDDVVKADGNKIIVYNKQAFSMKIEKVEEGKDGKPIQGVPFMVKEGTFQPGEYNWDATEKKGYTGTDGTLIIENLERGKTYGVHEAIEKDDSNTFKYIQVPDFVIALDKEGRLHIVDNANGDVTQPNENENTIRVVNKFKPKFTIKKVDENGKPLQGITFRVHKKGEEYGGTSQKTSSEGIAEFALLERNQTYVVSESIYGVEDFAYKTIPSFEVSFDQEGEMSLNLETKDGKPNRFVSLIEDEPFTIKVVNELKLTPKVKILKVNDKERNIKDKPLDPNKDPQSGEKKQYETLERIGFYLTGQNIYQKWYQTNDYGLITIENPNIQADEFYYLEETSEEDALHRSFAEKAVIGFVIDQDNNAKVTYGGKNAWVLPRKEGDDCDTILVMNHYTQMKLRKYEGDKKESGQEIPMPGVCFKTMWREFDLQNRKFIYHVIDKPYVTDENGETIIEGFDKERGVFIREFGTELDENGNYIEGLTYKDGKFYDTKDYEISVYCDKGYCEWGDERTEIEIEEGTEMPIFTARNKPSLLKIGKVDATKKNEMPLLAGAHLGIRDENGERLRDLNGNLIPLERTDWVSEETLKEFEGLFIKDRVYTVVETESKEGYLPKINAANHDEPKIMAKFTYKGRNYISFDGVGPYDAADVEFASFGYEKYSDYQYFLHIKNRRDLDYQTLNIHKVVAGKNPAEAEKPLEDVQFEILYDEGDEDGRNPRFADDRTDENGDVTFEGLIPYQAELPNPGGEPDPKHQVYIVSERQKYLPDGSYLPLTTFRIRMNDDKTITFVDGKPDDVEIIKVNKDGVERDGLKITNRIGKEAPIIVKIDDKKKPMVGVKFSITGKDIAPNTVIETDGMGRADIARQLAKLDMTLQEGERYTVQELNEPDIEGKSFKPIEPFTFGLGKWGSVDFEDTEHVKFKRETNPYDFDKFIVKNTLPRFIVKKVNDKGEVMPNVEFKVTFDGKHEFKFETDDNGQFEVAGAKLDGGTVTLEELGQPMLDNVNYMPERYDLTTKFVNGEFKIESASLPITEVDGKYVVTLMNKPTKAAINKVDEDGHSLAGVELVVIDAEKNEIATFTSGDQPKELIGLLKYGETYTIVEDKPKEGYVAIEPQSFTFNKDTTVIPVKNKLSRLKIHKVDESGKGLNGVTFKLVRDGKEHEATTDAEGNAEFVGFGVQQEYQLVEEKQDGYVQFDPVHVTIDKYGKVTEITRDGEVVTDGVTYDQEKGVLTVVNKKEFFFASYLSNTSTPLADCEYELMLDGVKKDRLVSELSSKVIGALEVGKTYTLKNTVVPNGIKKIKDVSFKVNDSGQLEIVNEHRSRFASLQPRVSLNEEKDTLELIHEPKIPFFVKKVEVVDDKEVGVLADVSFKIYDGDKVVKSFKSNDSSVDLSGELEMDHTYRLVESSLPGYKAIDAIVFRIDAKSKNVVIEQGKDAYVSEDGTLVVTNEKTKVILHKVNEEKEPLEFATFVMNGKEYVTDHDGNAIVYGLDAGASYSVQEVESPNGYVATDDFLIHVDEKDPLTEVVNKKAKYFIGSYFEKVQDGNELAGCEYLIKDGENVVSKVVSSTSIDEIVDALERNKTYTIEEVKVVDGIVYVDDVKFEINKRGELVLVGDYEHASVKGNDTIQIVHKPTRMDVRKVDESKHRLMGAVFELIDEDTNTVVHTWTSHDLKDEKIIKVLACDHRYVLKEVKVVDGYEDKQGDIHIAIDHKGRTMVDDEVVNDKLIVKVNNKIQEAVVEVPKTPSKKETVVSNEHKLSISTGDALFVRNYAMVLVSAIVGVVVSCVRLMK